VFFLYEGMVVVLDVVIVALYILFCYWKIRGSKL